MISGYPHPRVGLQWFLAASLLLVATLAQAQTAPEPAAADASQRTLLVMGDSLSAGYGMAAEEGWVSLLADDLGASRPHWKVVNASISGETSAGGAARIIGEAWRHQPDVLVIALGANDGLRGLPLAQLGANLGWMIGTAQAAGARVLLVGLQLPPNFGRYATDFQRSYVLISQRLGTGLVPHFLAPLGTERRWFQADNLHPVAAAQPLLAEQVLKALDALPPR